MTDLLRRLKFFVEYDTQASPELVAEVVAEIERLRRALTDIAAMHVPDQPAAVDVPEAEYLRRHIWNMRKAALTAATS